MGKAAAPPRRHMFTSGLTYGTFDRMFEVVGRVCAIHFVRFCGFDSFLRYVASGAPHSIVSRHMYRGN